MASAPRREYTDAEVDAAVTVLSDPERLAQAQRVVEASAPMLQRILNQALDEENWFDTAHQQQVLEAAVQALGEPGRLADAQRAIAAHAPQLQRILNQALEDADWFGSAHQAEVRKATAAEDPEARAVAVRTLIAEETRVVMLIGVAVGLELAHLLDHPQED